MCVLMPTHVLVLVLVLVLESQVLDNNTVIYLRNNPAAKFHRDPIRNDGALGFFDERRPNKMSSEM